MCETISRFGPPKSPSAPPLLAATHSTCIRATVYIVCFYSTNLFRFCVTETLYFPRNFIPSYLLHTRKKFTTKKSFYLRFVTVHPNIQSLQVKCEACEVLAHECMQSEGTRFGERLWDKARTATPLLSLSLLSSLPQPPPSQSPSLQHEQFVS